MSFSLLYKKQPHCLQSKKNMIKPFASHTCIARLHRTLALTTSAFGESILLIATMMGTVKEAEDDKTHGNISSCAPGPQLDVPSLWGMLSLATKIAFIKDSTFAPPYLEPHTAKKRWSNKKKPVGLCLRGERRQSDSLRCAFGRLQRRQLSNLPQK